MRYRERERNVSRLLLPRSERSRNWHDLKLRSESAGATAMGATAIGTSAIGAVALGALAIGALALGALAIGRLAIGRARIRRLEIDELVVRRLRITEEAQLPQTAPSSENSAAPATAPALPHDR
jgi:hypothetical protein